MIKILWLLVISLGLHSIVEAPILINIVVCVLYSLLVWIDWEPKTIYDLARPHLFHDWGRSFPDAEYWVYGCPSCYHTHKLIDNATSAREALEIFEQSAKLGISGGKLVCKECKK